MERDFDGGVIWRYSERTAVPSQQLAALLRRKISFNEGISAEFENARGRRCLIFLNNMLNDAYSKQVCDLFTRGSHHRNSVILMKIPVSTGNFYRDISLNPKYWLN